MAFQEEITKEYSKLTKHPSGSLKELIAISIPLMLSFFSNYLMLFVDRLILAYYSLDAMNAATTASLFCAIFQFGLIGIVSIAEVFIGQFNGSKKYEKVSSPVWQMIFFSLFCLPFFILLGKFSGPYFLPKYHYSDYALPYFQWLFYFLFTFGIQTALTSFFVGIGKTKIIIFITIIANLANILFDILLIFGIKHFIPSMGTKGAAIATGLAQIVQIVILFIFFFKKRYRVKYYTNHVSFDFKLIKKCLRIGAPTSFGHMIEITAWALIYYMMASLGEKYITTMAIGQNIYGLIAFGVTGLQKGVSTISANMIGAKDFLKIKKVWTSAVKLLLLIAVVVSAFLLIYPDFIINAFLKKGEYGAAYNELFFLLKVTCVFLWLYLIFDGITWITGGIF
ncbi:MAG: hypothetical protein A3F40_00485 [Chlamydiae bacterium RIFCSPHIGHO2_12_FULL_27_8]|nr:MAG: hypothetical protein A3F40_00485 [Chlamydiae bacterium RIFCSPHIGHO2_12_FULL_27_8]